MALAPAAAVFCLLLIVQTAAATPAAAEACQRACARTTIAASSALRRAQRLQRRQHAPTHAPNAHLHHTAPSRADPIVALSPLLGRRNASDTLAFDSSWAFRQHGSISRLTLWKAWYYDGAWHDPGELKGLQMWCACM